MEESFDKVLEKEAADADTMIEAVEFCATAQTAAAASAIDTVGADTS